MPQDLLDSPHLPADLAKSAPTLGHAVVLLVQAAGEIMERMRRKEDEPSRWIMARWQSLTGDSPLNPPIRQPFQLQVSLKADQWWVESCSAASPEVWRSIRWLLHLPSLRAVWEMQLRAARFEQLRLRVRPLWFMDEADPPPGTVIHHLNAASWHEVEQRLGPGGDLQAVAERWVEHRYALANSVSLAYVASADGRVSLASA
jgi:hypothetical protein